MFSGIMETSETGGKGSGRHSKNIQLRELKDMINDLKKMIKTLQATVDAANKREEALTQEWDNLKEEIDLLRKKLFGTSAKKGPSIFQGS